MLNPCGTINRSWGRSVHNMKCFLLFPANVNVNEEKFCLFSNELP